jgi:oxygen-dependent protoporphyrinogen oxidase
MTARVVVVGGGISGLAAAYELQLRRVPFTLLEASPRLGGLIRSEAAGDLLIDAGPDAMLAQKPAGIELARELGIADRLVSTRPPRTAFVLRNGTLHPLPQGSVLGVPTDVSALRSSTLLSPAGRQRIEAEQSLGADPAVEDESIAAFFERRFGREAVDYLAEPLLAGIHAGDVERLSVRALFPRLVDAARRGSVIATLRADLARASDAPGAFRSFPRGMQELVDALERRLSAGDVRRDTAAAALERRPEGFRVRAPDGTDVEARAVILAAPAHAAGALLAGIDAALASACDSMRSVSSAAVVLAYPRQAVGDPLAGSGFVVPRAERGVRMLAATWLSSKWPGRAPGSSSLMRAFFGGTRDPGALDLPDSALVDVAHQDLARLLRISARPVFARVYRWLRANAQYEVGYLQQLAALNARVASHRGLFVTGSAFGSIGIPDCIAEARRVARDAAALA